MANYNGEAFAPEAIRSVLEQSCASLELLFSDDGSSDASIEQALKAAAGDERLVIIENPHAGTPAYARNKALARARGDWIAIVDSDDFLARDRFERMLAAAERDKADIVADDLRFVVAGRCEGRLFTGALASSSQWIDAQRFIAANHIYGAGPALGYVKPIFRRCLLSELAAAYNEHLPIGEDYDLLLRLLLNGRRLRTLPYPTYFYRRHSGSISHRLSEGAIAALLRADDHESLVAADKSNVCRALRRRRRSIERAASFHEMLRLAKAGRLGALALAVLRSPQSALLFRVPIRDRWRKAWAHAARLLFQERAP